MSLPIIIPTDVVINGNLSVSGSNTPSAGSITNSHISDGAALARTKWAVENLTFAVPLDRLRKSADHKDILADAPDGTDLGLAAAIGSPVIGTTTNGGSTASESETAVCLFALPAEYSSGQAITVRLRAKVSVARTVSATIDLTAKLMGDGSLGSDICATDADDLTNSYADYDFAITPTGLEAGDVLALTITLATNDTGGSSDGYPALTAVSVICGCKG